MDDGYGGLAVVEMRVRQHDENRILSRIHENALWVLCYPGVKVHRCPEAKEILEESGVATYDQASGRILFHEPAVVQHYVDIAVEAGLNSFPLRPWSGSYSLGGAVTWVPTGTFNKKTGEEIWRSPTLEDVCVMSELAVDYQDLFPMWCRPFFIDKHHYETAKIMDSKVPQLKSMGMVELSDNQVVEFCGPEWVHWTDAVMSPLVALRRETVSIIRSAKLGAQLALASMPVSPAAPYTPEGLLTLAHAEVLFQIVLAQIANPGTVCIHAGYPCAPLWPPRGMAHGTFSHNAINAAMARINMVITRLPSNQAGGTTSELKVNGKALADGRIGRRLLRLLGFDSIRQAFGFGANTAFFSLVKFLQETRLERVDRRKPITRLPVLLLPEDPKVMDTICTYAVSGNFYNADNTLNNSGVWKDWEVNFVNFYEHLDWPMEGVST
jgi:trimethylamine:corrinoid methyltransferase-like protein